MKLLMTISSDANSTKMLNSDYQYVGKQIQGNKQGNKHNEQ